jgi:glucokinase
MSGFAIGVDLGGTNLRIAAVDREGKLLEKITTGTQVARGRDFVIGEMCAAIREVAAKFKRPLAGIGIGVPGIIDLESGMLHESPNLPGWEDYPVRDEIERRLKARVVLENDANAAALGEQWLGAARDYDSMAMLTLGTGVGGGLVLEGKIWHGMSGMVAELGHITVLPDGPPCACGSRGCLEQFASATAIKRMAVEAIASGNAPELARAMKEDAEFSARMVFQMAAQGDVAAKEIFVRVGWALGIALAGLVNIFNLPMYVIGGGVSGAWEAFAPAMMDEVRRRSFVYRATAPDLKAPAKKQTMITRAVLGSDAGLYGAARLPMIERAIRREARRPAR